MIHDDEELAVVQKQLALAEHALEALRQRVKNPRNLAVFSEGPIDQINDLKREIDAYLKKTKPKTNGVVKKRKASKREKV
jgi:hypothetical protein